MGDATQPLRSRPLKHAAEWIRAAKCPLIVAGGGVLYSAASRALSRFADSIGIPVCETHAGKGSLHFDHALNVGAIGVTGTPSANILAREADLIIGIGTRYSDFHDGIEDGLSASIRPLRQYQCL